MNVIKVNENDFNTKIKNTQGKILVDCYANWCGPCKMLSPIIDELANEYNSCTFFKLDVDESPNIVNEYNIMSIPTLLLFENGQILKQDQGMKSKEQLITFIEE